MDDAKQVIIEIRKGLIEQFILATGQFVGEIDRILSSFGFNDENIINSSPMMFAYFTVRMVIIEATKDFCNIEFSYIDENKKAIAKTWASRPEMISETLKDLEIATKLFNKVIDNCKTVGNFDEADVISMRLSKEFVAILFSDPLKDERLKKDLTLDISIFYTKRYALLESLFKEVVKKIENSIKSRERA